ncbi:ribose-phosphate pyrophosphokinase [Patescibacteria group bacterium]|nr:ribose-phosphate pyrophosphokinase [Patescibacteria group bacterium]
MEIARKLNTSLSPLEIHVLPDGEKRLRVLDKVLEEDCAVVQSCSTPVDQNYMELFLLLDALKRSGARDITAVIPYLGYARQDHIFREGEAVSLEVIIKILESMGVSKVIIFDPHTIKAKDLFHIPVSQLSALKLFAERIKEEGLEKNSILVSPDMGGVRRIKILSEILDMPFAILEKNRNLETGEVKIEKSQGLNSYKRAIIVDDMISSGGTIDIGAKYLRENGIEEVFVFATHAVFSDRAPKVLSASETVKKVFVTDTVKVPENKQFPKLQVIPIAKMVAENLK